MDVKTLGKTHIKIEAVVTRADGTVEDLGVIAEGSGEMEESLWAQIKEAWKLGQLEAQTRKDKT